MTCWPRCAAAGLLLPGSPVEGHLRTLPRGERRAAYRIVREGAHQRAQARDRGNRRRRRDAACVPH